MKTTAMIKTVSTHLSNELCILPVAAPFLSGYPVYGNTFSILGSSDDVMPWFYNYFIQISMDKGMESALDFSIGISNRAFLQSCPLLICDCISRSFIRQHDSSIQDFLIDAIDNGYYAFFVINTYYVKPYGGTYLKSDRDHPILVYGYDKTSGQFYTADNFMGKYDYQPVDFQELCSGYDSCLFDNFEGILLLKKRDYPQYYLNPETLKMCLEDHLNSTNCSLLINTKFTHDLINYKWSYGMEAYAVLLQKSIQSDTFDLRSFHLIYEHKKILCGLISYLERNFYLRPGFDLNRSSQQLLKHAQILEMNALKSNTTDKRQDKNHTLTNLETLMEEETAFIRNLLQSLLPAPEISYSVRRFRELHSNELQPVQNMAVFLEKDTITLGNWKGKYGSKGYWLANNQCQFSEPIRMSVSEKQQFLFRDGNISDPAFLECAGGREGRVMCTVYNKKEFTIDIFGGQNRTICSIYALGYGDAEFKTDLELWDPDSKQLFFRDSALYDAAPQYIRIAFRGFIRIRLIRRTGHECSLCGIFFD